MPFAQMLTPCLKVQLAAEAAARGVGNDGAGSFDDIEGLLEGLELDDSDISLQEIKVSTCVEQVVFLQ